MWLHMGITVKWGPDGSFTAPGCQSRREICVLRIEFAFSLGLPPLLVKRNAQSAVKHQLKLILFTPVSQICLCVITAAWAVSTALCAREER